MATIDVLLRKAKDKLSELLYKAFEFGEDSFFIDALGLNSEKYKVEFPNGEIGYDDIAALKDVVPEVWNDYEE